MLLDSATNKYKDIDIFNRFVFLTEESSCLDLSLGHCTIPPSTFIMKTLQNTALDTYDHQYAPSQGYFPLLTAISEFYSQPFERKLNPLSNVLVSAGCTSCISEILLAFINPGDEVIVIEPYYTAYEVMILQVHGVMVSVCMTSNIHSCNEWKIDTEKLRKAFSPKTKLMIFNSPHNPTGKIFTREELQAIADLCIEFDVLCLADEVYSSFSYDANIEIVHMATVPDMWERTVTVFSAGKLFGVTGWRLGWSIAPSEIIQLLLKVHSNFQFNIPTPIQKAVTTCLMEEIAAKKSDKSSLIKPFATQLIKNRDRIVTALKTAGLIPIIPSSGYFMFVDLSSSIVLNESGEETFSWLKEKYNIGCMPGICFFTEQHRNSISKNLVRLCFARNEDIIDQAVLKFTNSV